MLLDLVPCLGWSSSEYSHKVFGRVPIGGALSFCKEAGLNWAVIRVFLTRLDTPLPLGETDIKNFLMVSLWRDVFNMEPSDERW